MGVFICVFARVSLRPSIRDVLSKNVLIIPHDQLLLLLQVYWEWWEIRVVLEFVCVLTIVLFALFAHILLPIERKWQSEMPIITSRKERLVVMICRIIHELVFQKATAVTQTYGVSEGMESYHILDHDIVFWVGNYYDKNV